VIREARREDLPAIRLLMEAEPGFWQRDWNTMPANNAFARTVSSHALAAAAQGGRWTTTD